MKHEIGNKKRTKLEINVKELVKPKLEPTKISYKHMQLFSYMTDLPIPLIENAVN